MGTSARRTTVGPPTGMNEFRKIQKALCIVWQYAFTRILRRLSLQIHEGKGRAGRANLPYHSDVTAFQGN
jgi:hypothetical protein